MCIATCKVCCHLANSAEAYIRLPRTSDFYYIFCCSDDGSGPQINGHDWSVVAGLHRKIQDGDCNRFQVILLTKQRTNKQTNIGERNKASSKRRNNEILRTWHGLELRSDGGE